MGTGPGEIRKRAIGKSEKKQMFSMMIVNSKAGLGETSRGKNAFPWVLKPTSRRQALIYFCVLCIAGKQVSMQQQC